MLITIDGGDGSGKGKQIDFLRAWLANRRLDYVFLRDPGDTDLGEAVRDLLLHRNDLAICPKTELALFMASRAQLVHEKIKPALKNGHIVLVDRYLLSTVVYQGYAVGAADEEIEWIWRMGKYLADGIMPEITFVLDCPSQVAFERINRTKDRMESKGSDFHRRVAEGYRQAVGDWGKYGSGEVYLIDATLSPDEVFAKIRSVLEDRVVR